MMKGIVTSQGPPASAPVFQKQIQAQWQFVRMERHQYQIRPQNGPGTPPVAPGPRAPLSPEPNFPTPEDLPLYNQVGRLKGPNSRSQEGSLELLPLGKLKALVHKVWKDLSKGDAEALLKDVNRWVRSIWDHGRLDFTSADQYSLDFELNLEGTTVWRGSLVALDFHLELHLEQGVINPEEAATTEAPQEITATETSEATEAPALEEITTPEGSGVQGETAAEETMATESIAAEAPEAEAGAGETTAVSSEEALRLHSLGPQVVDTGRFRIAWLAPSRLEVFDKALSHRVRFEDASAFSFRYQLAYQFQTVTISLLDGAEIRWEQGDAFPKVTVTKPVSGETPSVIELSPSTTETVA